MISISPTNVPEFPYDQAQFDAGYYGAQARGGFGEEINWDHPQQQIELQNKFDVIAETGEFKTILFVGCALGNEVRFFRAKEKEAQGVEISAYAVEHCDPSVKEWIHLYNGWNLEKFADQSMDVVAAFDVLGLIPRDILDQLATQIRRVSKNRIIFRTPIDPTGDQQGQYIGNDGVSFANLTQVQWCEIFEQDGFKLTRIFPTNNVPSEHVFIFSKT